MKSATISLTAATRTKDDLMNDITLIQFLVGLPLLFFGMVLAGLLACMIDRIAKRNNIF